MGMNQHTKNIIDDGANIISEYLSKNPSLSATTAKRLIRNRLKISRVANSTLNRITLKGKNSNRFRFDGTSFYKTLPVTPVADPRLLRDFATQWARDTSVDANINNIRSQVLRGLVMIGDPKEGDDIVALLQQYYAAKRSEITYYSEGWRILGSLRSFARWCVEGGFSTGDVSMLWPSTEVQKTIRVGHMKAHVDSIAMSITGNRWPYKITHPNTNDLSEPFWLREDEVEFVLRRLDQAYVLQSDPNYMIRDLADILAEGDVEAVGVTVTTSEPSTTVVSEAAITVDSVEDAVAAVGAEDTSTADCDGTPDVAPEVSDTLPFAAISDVALKLGACKAYMSQIQATMSALQAEMESLEALLR